MHTNRVDFDRKIFEVCLDQGKPTFGICAGLQHINIIYGGTLYEDILTQLPNSINHGDYKGPVVNHPIKIDKNSMLFDIVDSDSLSVNSTHHQGIKNLGKNLKPTAWTDDGLIEAVEGFGLPDRGRFIAVQWHPELMFNTPEQMAIFLWLVREAS